MSILNIDDYNFLIQDYEYSINHLNDFITTIRSRFNFNNLSNDFFVKSYMIFFFDF